MGGLLIRADRKNGVLRSVGDPPNGIVTIGYPDGPSWMVDAGFEPPRPCRDRGVVVVEKWGVFEDQRERALETADVVEALEDQETGYVLWMYAVAAVEHAAKTFGRAGDFEALIGTAQWAIETRDALIERGWLGVAG